MKIGAAGPVSRPSRVKEKKKATTADRLSTPRRINDTSSVMGIPEAEFTPKVKAAIMTLMQEVDSLRQQVETATRRMESMERLADQDTLLPIYNRRAFVRELTRLMMYSERYGATASLVFLDLNGFKKINDEHGHAAGDEALKRVSELLVENVRGSDVVGRLGGDEFGVILAQASEDAALAKAKELAAKIADLPLFWDGVRFNIGAAYGVTAFKPGENAAEALEAADQAMFDNKKASGQTRAD